MAPASALGIDLVSAVAIGAAGVVASTALYALSGSGKKDKEVSVDSAAPKTNSSSTTVAVVESDGETKLTKKQRQKLNKQKKREETLPPIQAETLTKVASDSEGNQSPTEEKKKKKKSKSKKNKAKSVETTESTEDVSAPAPGADEQEEPVDNDGELQFALALAGNQKNMRAMRNDQKTKQQKEADRLERKKSVEEREKREKEKAEELAKIKFEAEEAENAKSPQQETTVIALKARQVQIILSSGGKVIKQIRQESGARLDVSKRDDESTANNKDRRLLTIVGTAEQIDTARKLLRAAIKEENEKSEVVEIGDKMAAVIGKGGSVIKRIKEETGATLDADRDTGTIRVSGEPEQIERAVIEIKKISAPGDQISMRISKRQKMLVIGKGGLMIRKIEELTNCQLDVEKTEDGGGILKIGGDSTQVLEAMKTIQKLFHEASFTVTVQCGHVIGAVIGKGGEVIRKIQEETKVKLDVDMDKKCVVIIGYEKDVMHAKDKIEAILACPVEVKAGEMKMHIDLAGYVSSIIGRGGSKVREIEESSGATVKVLGTECIIVGKQKNVENAKSQIDEILKKRIEASVRTEAAIKAVQALSDTHTRVSKRQDGQVAWGSSAWGPDLHHWTPAPVAATR